MIESPHIQEQLPEGVIEKFEEGSVATYTLGKPLNGRWLFSSPESIAEYDAADDGSRTHERKRVLDLVTFYAQQHNVATVAVPRVDRFNAGITDIASLHNVEPETQDDVTLVRGDDESFFFDGFILQPGEGAAIPTGDCPTIVLWTNEPDSPLVAAHAGRNSLHTVAGHTHTDDVPSVVDAAIEKLHTDPATVHVRIIAGIGASHFTHPREHPEHSGRNKAMIEYFATLEAADENDPSGKIDVTQAIRQQLLNLGVQDEHISSDKLDTKSDERLWSNREGNKERNTILVLNKGKIA